MTVDLGIRMVNVLDDNRKGKRDISTYNVTISYTTRKRLVEIYTINNNCMHSKSLCGKAKYNKPLDKVACLTR